MKYKNQLSKLVFCTLTLIIFVGGFSQLFITAATAAVGINRQINFQGKVVNKTSETNIANGTYSFTFKFFDAATAGTQLPSGAAWTETKNLVVTNGIFRTALGDTTAIPSTLDFNADNIYLDMTFNGEVFTTRIRMTSVPYAFNAEKVAGLTVTNTTGTLTIPNAKTISFADAFTTSGAFATTLTSTAATNVTLPTTGTLLTNTASVNQTITSAQTSGTVLGITDATNITAAIKGEVITLSGTGAFDQTGLEFNLSGATGTNRNDIVGTGGLWKVSNAGVLTVASCTGCGAGSSAWNALTVPTGDLTLAMDADKTTFNWIATGALDSWTMSLNNNAGAITAQHAFSITNAVTSQTADINTESLIHLDNADTLAAGSTVVDDAILITASGDITDAIVNAIDASDPDITNAMSIGANRIIGTTAEIDFSSFDVLSTGEVLSVGANVNAGLLQGTGGFTLTGTTLINNTTASNTTIGNSAGGTITIGASTGSDLVLNDAQWSITGAGVANFVSVGATTPGSGAFTTLSATGDVTMNDAGADNILIGAAADTVTLTSDTLSLADNNWSITAAGASTFVSVTSPSYTGAGAVTLSSGASAGLTLDSASGVLTIAAGDNTLRRTAAGIYTVDLSDTADTTFAITNSSAGAGIDAILRVDSLVSCDTIDTNASGDLVCGNDAGAASSPFTTTTGVIAKTTSTDRLRLTMAEAGDYGLLIDTSVAPSVDLVQIDTANAVAATTGVDAFSIIYRQAASVLDLITGSALDITIAAQSGESGDTIRGLRINDITGGGAVEHALSIGTGWDAAIKFTGAGDIDLVSASTTALTISEAATNYMTFDTSVAAEKISLGVNLVLSGDAAEGVRGGGLSDCDLATQKLLWDDTTNKFSCGSDQTIGSGVRWDQLTAPSADLTLAHADFLTSFSWDTAAAANRDYLKLALTNDIGTNTQQLMSLINNDSTGITEALMFLNNADTTAASLLDGILITSSGVNAGITDAIDVSAANILNAINIGTNTILGTTGVIDFTNFDVSSGGALTFNGVGTDITTTSGENLTLDAAGAGILVFTGYDCSALTNGGALTADASGNISCSADDGGGGGTAWNAITVPTADLTLAMDADRTTFDWSTLTTTNAWTMTANGLTTGKLFNLTSTSNVLTSGELAKIDHTATYTTSQTVSGNLLDLNKSLTQNGAATTMTASGVSSLISETYTATLGTINVTGNALNISRGGSAAATTTLNISGALASFTDSALTGAGTLTHSANVVNVIQSQTNNSGNALNVTHAGSAGNAVSITKTGSGGGLLIDHTGSAGNALEVQRSSVAALVVDINGKVLINSGSNQIFPQFFSRTNAPAATNGFNNNGMFAVGSIGNANTSGRIWVKANGVNYRFNSTNSLADYSEYLQQEETSEPGDVMVLSDSKRQTVKRGTKPYDQKVLGVVTIYGTSNNGDGDCWDETSCDRSRDPKWANVGMLGQVYTKVSIENGEIRPGDPLVTSSVRGVAMKATKTGRIVGYAIDYFDGTASGKDLRDDLPIYSVHEDTADPPGDPPPTTVKVGKIIILLQAGWYDPSAPPPDIGNIGVEKDESGLVYALRDNSTGLIMDNDLVAKNAVFGNVKAGLVVSRELVTDGLEVKGKAQIKEAEMATIDIATDSAQLVMRGHDKEIVFSIDKSGNAYFKGTLTAENIKANKIDGLDVFDSRLSALEQKLASIDKGLADNNKQASEEANLDASASAVLSSSTSALLDELASESAGTSGNALVMSSLNVDGLATVSADLRVKGNGLIEGILNVIDTLTTNNLIVNGISDFFNNVVFHNSVAFKGTPTFNKDTAGYATILKESKRVEVKFEKEYKNEPVVNASLVTKKLTDAEFNRYKVEGICDSSASIQACQEKIDQLLLTQVTQYVIADRSKKGFSIVIEKNAQTDLDFSWSALSVEMLGSRE